jgi:rare lipoprotein A
MSSRLVATTALALLLAACGSAPKRSVYYQDDGPPDRVPADVASIPDAVPRVEPINPRNSRPYVVLGRSYAPLVGDVPFRQRGMASWYGRQFHGNRTANGEIYDMFAMTAAHPTLPLPSYVRVTHLGNGRSAIVRVNDRGPFLSGRVIDLSYAAAAKLGIAGPGTGEVEVERITYAQIAAGDWGGTPTLVRAPVPAPASEATDAATAATAVAVAPPPAAVATPLPTAAAVAAERHEAAVEPRWSVQLGAFAHRSNADAFAARIAALLGLVDASQLAESLRTPRIESDEGLFRVLIGVLPDRWAALGVADQLERLLGRPTSLLVR